MDDNIYVHTHTHNLVNDQYSYLYIHTTFIF